MHIFFIFLDFHSQNLYLETNKKLIKNNKQNQINNVKLVMILHQYREKWNFSGINFSEIGD
jgi:hypothetical protein